MSGDVTAAIERLRRKADSDHDARGAQGRDADALGVVLAEVERLRAEREALHSDETEERVVDALTRATVGPDGNLSELTAGDAGNIWTAVLNVISPNPQPERDDSLRRDMPGFEGTWAALDRLTIRPKGTDA